MSYLPLAANFAVTKPGGSNRQSGLPSIERDSQQVSDEVSRIIKTYVDDFKEKTFSHTKPSIEKPIPSRNKPSSK